MSGVPYIFGTATTSIPLSQLDTDFATPVTIGSTTVALGNTTTTLAGLTGVTSSAITDSGLTSGRVTYAGTGGLLQDSANLTFNGTTLTAAGFSGPISGVVTSTSITDSGLTSGRVTYATTGGLLTDSANLLYSGTDLTVYGITVGRGGSGVNGNSALGSSALSGNTTGSNNTGVGFQALNAQTTGGDNTAIGFRAAYLGTAFSTVVAVGSNALAANTASDNVAIGASAAAANTSGTNNTVVGRAAFTTNTTGSNNTALGHQSLQANTTSSNNTAVGYQALYSETTAGNNTAVGYQAGRAITTGTDSVYIGSLCGYYTTNSINGNNNVFVGPYCHGSGTNISAEYLFGYNLAGKGNETFFVSGSSGAYNSANSLNWSVTSDQRLKKNIVDNNVGLEKINAIQVRNFEYCLPEEITEVSQEQAIKKEGIQLGVIAQELQLVLPECVKTETTGIMTVDADNLTWYLINAVKELSARIKQLEGN